MDESFVSGKIMVIGAHAGDAEVMAGATVLKHTQAGHQAVIWRADVYLDATDVWDDYLAMLHAHALTRGGISSFRYFDYYDALGTTRGCLGGFTKAVALMMTPGAWVRRVDYLL